MVMTQSHKDAIKKGVQSYHACAKSHGCGKGNKATAKKPVKKAVKKPVKKAVKKPVKKAVKKAVAKPVKKAVKKPVKEFKTPKLNEIFKDNIKSPTPKKKLTEKEIQKLEMEDLDRKVNAQYIVNQRNEKKRAERRAEGLAKAKARRAKANKKK